MVSFHSLAWPWWARRPALPSSGAVVAVVGVELIFTRREAGSGAWLRAWLRAMQSRSGGASNELADERPFSCLAEDAGVVASSRMT